MQLSTVRRLTLVAATIATGLAAGFFYAYHVSVTRGHALIGDRAYLEAMQAINATVRNWEFFLGFFGALILGAAALALRAGRWRSATTWLVAAGVGLYLAAFLVTMLVNVPMNEELAQVALEGADLAAVRADYEPPWNRANALRTGLSIAGFAFLVAAVASDQRPTRPRDAAATGAPDRSQAPPVLGR
jgi:uncharacterized membrane protein